MLKFVRAENWNDARNLAPWATIYRKHNGGYMAFLRARDFRKWKQKLKKYY